MPEQVEKSKEIEKKVINIIADQAMLEPSSLSRDSSLADLGLDSLGVVEIVYAIEEDFDITVPFNANEPDNTDFDLSTVGSVVAAVESLIADTQG